VSDKISDISDSLSGSLNVISGGLSGVSDKFSGVTDKLRGVLPPLGQAQEGEVERDEFVDITFTISDGPENIVDGYLPPVVCATSKVQLFRKEFSIEQEYATVDKE